MVAVPLAALGATGWSTLRPSDPRAADVTTLAAAPVHEDMAPPASVDATRRSSGRTPLVVDVDDRWAHRVSARTGIPVTAVRAYGRASLMAARATPACHLGWTTLAAIGSVESDHGRSRGAHLTGAGLAVPTIIGPVLDGSAGNAAVPVPGAAKAGHDAPVWDHAVGPMQFITSSWRSYGADADGDGVANPNDIYDAAWGAARHLCVGGRDLSTGPGWSSAVLGYNHSNAYLTDVFRRAQAYGR